MPSGATDSSDDALNAERLRILLVEDDPDHVFLVRAHLEDLDADIVEVSTLAEARKALASDVAFDLAIVDLGLPDGSGVTLAADASVTGRTAILALTASTDLPTLRRAVAAGVHGHLSKPFQAFELIIAVENALVVHRRHQVVERLATVLADKVATRSASLLSAQEDAIQHLAAIAERRDPETGGHLRRIAEHSETIATTIGLERSAAREIRLAAPLHDIGKIVLPDRLLYAGHTFDDDERAHMATHTIHGWEILKDAQDNPIMATAALIARHHHERIDGTGHPDGLTGDEIPLAARITAVADVYDALSQARRYKEAFPPAEVAAALRRPGHLDQDLVEALLGSIG